MKTYKNISVRATRTNVVRNNKTNTIIQQIGVEVIDINTGRGWKIWLNAKYYEKGRLLKELKDCVERCCVDQIVGLGEEVANYTIESLAIKIEAMVQQCIDDNDIYSYTTIGRGGKLVEHYYYPPKNTFKCEEDKSLKERYPEEVEYILTMADSIIEQNASDGKEITFGELVNELVYKLHEATDEPYSDEVYEKKAKRLGLNDLPTLWYPNKKEIEEILDEDNDTMGYLDRHHNNTMVAEPTLFEQENQVDDTTNIDKPQANTETNKNNNTMNRNREKMMGGVVTTKKGLTINVWGLKNNNYQVKVSKGNRKASFEVPMPKCIPEVDPGFFRPVIAKYIEKHMEDLQMPELLSPNVKKAHKDQWNQNKDEWVAYGKRISDNYTIEYPNEAANEQEQKPVVIEEPQAVVEEQVVEDTPMVEDKTNEQSIIKKLVVETREGVDKISNDTLNSLKELAAGADEGFEVDGVNIVDIYTAITLAQVNKKWESRVYGLLKNSWYPKDLKVYKMEVANKAAGLIKNPDSMTPEDITRLRLVAKEACDEDLTRICELTYELSVCLKNATAKASEILNIACPDPVVEEVSKVPQEVEQVVEEPKVDDDEDKHWDIRIETTHNESDGNTYYLARVKRWDYIDHSINKNCGTLQVSFTHYPCLKDNPKEIKRVKDLIKSICVENRHLLKRDNKYCYLFDNESITLFRNKVEERWQAEVKQYENVA